MEALTHSTRALNALTANPKKVMSHLRRSKKPVLLTQNGKPEFILIDARKLSKKISAKQLERLIDEAEMDIAAGRYEDFDQYMNRFRDAHNL